MDYDPIKSSDIMSMLNVDPAHLAIPAKYQKLRDVLDYFTPFDNYRYYVLKVTSGKFGDKLDSVWNYVALQKEREAILSQFTAEEFAPDIEEQLKDKYLTTENIGRIRKDVDEKMQLVKEREANRAHTAEIRNNEQQAVKKINLKEVSKNLDSLEEVNKIIDKY